MSRRTALKIGAGAAALPLCHIRTAGAAGSLAIAFTTSLVPGWDDVIRKLVEGWGERNKVEVRADFLNAINDQLILTQAAEAQSRAGHDIIDCFDYDVATYVDRLEPVDDVVGHLLMTYGPLTPGIDDFAKRDGVWRAVPMAMASQYRASVTRIDLFREHVGMDVQAVFPVAAEMGPGYDQWTWDAFLIAAEKCFKAGVPFGLQISNCTDANAWINALFDGFGVQLVDAKGAINVRSDATREALGYLKRLAPFLPPDVYTWNNASDNRAMIAGKSALIFDPPSPWAGALKDNPPVGEQIWHHPPPAGKHGRYTPFNPNYLGIWNFSTNKTAAKELIAWLSEREQVEASCVASQGYDIPPFVSMTDFPIWAEAGPPKGTLFNYPLRPAHHAKTTLAGAPAPPAIAHQIQAQWTLPKLVARVAQSGMSIEQSIALAEQELEGFMR